MANAVVISLHEATLLSNGNRVASAPGFKWRKIPCLE